MWLSSVSSGGCSNLDIRRGELTGDTKDGELPRAGVVNGLQETKVANQDGLVPLLNVGEPESVTDIIDADPNADKRVVGLPRSPGGVRINSEVGDEKILDLVLEAQHLGRKRRDQVCCRRGAAGGQVV